MTPQELFAKLVADGVRLKLSADGANLVVPAGSLSADQRALVLSHKADILALLVEARKTTSWLIEAAMQVCDKHNDSEAAREEMRQDCLRLPPHLRQDLLDHFTDKS